MPVQRSQQKRRPQPPAHRELPSAVAVGAVPLATGRNAKGQFADPLLARAMAKKPRRRDMLPKSLPCDATFEPFNRTRLDWLRKRTDEYLAAFGYVSHGVTEMLAAAAWAYAGGEYASQLASQRLDVDLWRVAANLTTTARGHDRMAWELAGLEAEALRKNGNPLAALDRQIDSFMPPVAATTPAPLTAAAKEADSCPS